MECVQSVSTWLKGSVQSSIHHVGNLCGQSLVVTEQNRSPQKTWTNKDSLPLRPIETFDIKNKWPRLLFASSFNNLHVCQDCVIGLSEQNLRIYRTQEFLYSFFISLKRFLSLSLNLKKKPRNYTITLPPLGPPPPQKKKF